MLLAVLSSLLLRYVNLGVWDHKSWAVTLQGIERSFDGLSSGFMSGEQPGLDLGKKIVYSREQGLK